MHKFLSVSPCKNCKNSELPKDKCSENCQILELYQLATAEDPNAYNQAQDSLVMHPTAHYMKTDILRSEETPYVGK